MIGTINCIYETPCGWCSKWDKECDKKTPKRGQRAKSNPVDDMVDENTNKYIKEVFNNKICQSEEDHEWECCGVSTAGSTFVCKKCFAHKTYPRPQNISL